MSSSSPAVYVPAQREGQTRATFPIEDRRGIYGMYTVIATELSLFICLFASYYFLGGNKDRWAVDQPPKLHYALIMLVVLLASSAVLIWGERQVKLQREGAARAAIFVTVLIGIGFVVLQCLEYAEHWKTLTPASDSYGSIFYTITTFHGAHVAMGLLLLAYVGILPRYGPTVAPPYRPYRVVSLYWHFVDLVWVFIVALLYVVPNLQAR
jgi:heme/copper-type cytochrome/quinol oxidase subunit 3